MTKNKKNFRKTTNELKIKKKKVGKINNLLYANSNMNLSLS